VSPAAFTGCVPLIRAAERWKSIKVTEYETQVGLDRKSSKAAAHTKISSSAQT
jgi:hypothetical protein